MPGCRRLPRRLFHASLETTDLLLSLLLLLLLLLLLAEVLMKDDKRKHKTCVSDPIYSLVWYTKSALVGSSNVRSFDDFYVPRAVVEEEVGVATVDVRPASEERKVCDWILRLDDSSKPNPTKDRQKQQQPFNEGYNHDQNNPQIQ